MGSQGKPGVPLTFVKIRRELTFLALPALEHCGEFGWGVGCVDEEAGEGAPAEEGDDDEHHEREFLDGYLSLFADGDAPADAEVPKAVAEVIACRQDSEKVDDKDKIVVGAELLLPRGVLDHLMAIDLRVDGCGDHVIDEEHEDKDAAPALEEIHSVLGPLVSRGEVVLLAAVDDKKTVDGMEEEGESYDPNFHYEQEMSWDSSKESENGIELFGPHEAKGVQRKVLKHIEPDGDDSGEGVKFVPEVVFSSNGHGFELGMLPGKG